MTQIINVKLERSLFAPEYISDGLNIDTDFLPENVLKIFKEYLDFEAYNIEDEEELEEFIKKTFYDAYTCNVETVSEKIWEQNGKYWYAAEFKSEFTLECLPNIKFICIFDETEVRIDDYKKAPDYEEIMKKVELLKEDK